ncbi:MAG TPA: UbiA family prenyltransferase [Candidatus Saccharimonadales bacterium]|nr:UbiA family prenyltransferase [Candidatus Saccharimonadales bacterium]
MATLRSLLVLGRVSNLPTVWSNCLAGWWLAGGGSGWLLVLLCAAATCLYTGGMYLNDAFDAQFDQQHRPERPIPSGAIPAQVVWLLGMLWLCLGLGGLVMFGRTSLVCGVLLVSAILVYDAIHKIFAFSPVLMAGCRFLLVLLAASTGREGISGLAVWSGLALAAYIIGLSYLARQESALVALRLWPCLSMTAPFVLAYIVNRGTPHMPYVWLLTAFLGFWLLRSVGMALWSSQPNVGRAVSRLLAAIPLLDLLSIWEGDTAVGAILAGLFLLCLLLQRVVPAT